LIISTSKHSRADGEVYYNFIVQAVKQAPLFSWLSFQAQHFWEVLLYVDSANYGGIITSDQLNNDPDDVIGSNQAVISNWNLAEVRLYTTNQSTNQPSKLRCNRHTQGSGI
jgi:hypothetical protein